MAKAQKEEKVNILHRELPYLEAKEKLEKEITTYTAEGRKGDLMFAMLQLAVIAIDLGNLKDAVKLNGESAAYILKYGSEEQKGLALFIKGRLQSYQAEFEEGMNTAIRSLHHFLQTDIHVYIAKTYVLCGIMCRRLGMFDEGMDYFNKAIETARHTGNKGLIAMCMQNMNEIKLELLQPSESIKEFKEFLAYLHIIYEGKHSHTEANAYYILSELYLYIGDIKSARQSLKKAEMIKAELGTNSRWVDYINRHAEILAHEGDQEGMLRELDKIFKLSKEETVMLAHLQAHTICFDFYIKRMEFDKALPHIEAPKKILKGNTEALIMKHVNQPLIAYYQGIGDIHNEIKYLRLHNEYELNMQRQIIQHRMKHVSVVHELELKEKENEIMKKELNLKSQELNLANHYLQQRNELLNDLKGSINSLKSENAQRESIFQTLFKKIDMAFNKEENERSIFKEKFDQAHVDFIQNLSSRFPKLSPSECRICALLHSGFNTKEIATLLSTSERNIETHRLNIRKKIGLKRGENLQIVLTSVK